MVDFTIEKYYTKQQIRRGLAHYQNIDHSEKLYGTDGIKKLMRKLHSIQYDPLNVVGRNADLVLQARIADYRSEMLEYLLYTEHFLTDGFDKEMCIYITEDFERFENVRQIQAQSAERTLSYRGQTEALNILQEVRAFVSANGLTGTKDISIGEVRESRWGHKKLSSAALDYLYTKGELCVAKKIGTQKQFDLTERVIPKDYFSGFRFMTIEQFLDWYVKRRIAGVGILWGKRGGAWQGNYLWDNELRKSTIARLAEKGELKVIHVEGITEEFYCCEDFLESLKSERASDYARFIAPLDNMIWDRKMTESIFDFSYSWEVYTPVSKRKYGYYVLPVLYNDSFVARFEAVPVSKGKCFEIKNWWWEKGVLTDEKITNTIMEEMERFADLHNVTLSSKNQKQLEVRL
ncbi:hypothetical protein B5F53_06435 [Blautia sp. An249]|uniref:DNA glycosylase AlkZ-like family protein n=1 Tax=Blautia sp. An249 TaxID=1965603 RepID=UPI000B3919F4|nr:winged helix DNA-binding domain-containing protein [Blautia sp. An249]OUO79589.1 hypothetical protein B5F53_06435 [Blautia sp. An249]